MMRALLIPLIPIFVLLLNAVVRDYMAKREQDDNGNDTKQSRRD